MKYFYGLNIPIRRVTSNIMHTIHQVMPKVRKIGFSLQVYYKGAFILEVVNLNIYIMPQAMKNIEISNLILCELGTQLRIVSEHELL